jgi:aminoglycoside phosphotransferase (APT) family kinase protein
VDPRDWAADRSLTSELVAKVVSEQFPALRGAELRPFNAGWDSEVYEVDREWLLRFPKRREVVGRLEREVAALPLLAAALPLPIPRFELLGRPSATFPYPFVGYRKLPGSPLIEQLSTPLSREDEREAARTLGDFLTVLHGIRAERLPVKLARGESRDVTGPPEGFETKLAYVRACDADLARRVAEHYASLRPVPAPRHAAVTVHSDLDVEHLLVSQAPTRLTGVIDWGDLEVGQAARDFVGTYSWGGRRFAEMVLAHYRGPVRAEDLDWVRAQLVHAGLTAVAYGRMASRTEYVASGLHALESAFAS